MATQLDFQEQESVDQVKAFWSTYGNLITAVIVLCLLAYGGWNGWQWWQRDQAAKASAMYDELDKAARAADLPKVDRVLGDMQDRYPRTTFTSQAALLAASVHADKGQLDAAGKPLAWVGDNAPDTEYRTIARLRWAGLLLDEKKYDEALKQLDAADAKSFEALVADRRGDVLIAQNKVDDAKAAYAKAWTEMDTSSEYRRVVEAKLVALGGSTDGDKAVAKP
jgi:predicted negative regulator of RcsB-dependent stress response